MGYTSSKAGPGQGGGRLRIANINFYGMRRRKRLSDWRPRFVLTEVLLGTGTGYAHYFRRLRRLYP